MQSDDQQTMSPSDQWVTPQAPDQPVMSADQIIGIMRQDPTVLASVKETAAQQVGVDPTTITDDALYSRIQQDATLRAQMTPELNKLGFSTDVILATKNSTSGTQVREPSKPKPQPAPDVDLDKPQMVQRLDPYKNLPSLHDLYTQIPSAGGQLRRFGSDAFLEGTGNANELPMDLPVGPDYVLGPGDNIVVNMWGGRSARLSMTIDRQGQIALPEVGTIALDSLTIAQAQAAIQKSLGTQFQDEHVEISLGKLRTVRVYVVGDVQRPGAYDVSSMSTPLSALYTAGGPTSRGSLRVMRQYRGNTLVREIDLYDFLLRGVRSNVDRLLPGDTVMVPPYGPQVTVEGMVHRPAIYELNGEQSLSQVLDLAGGALISASLKQINVSRIEAHERRTMLSLDLPDDAVGSKQKLTDFRVQAGDDVVISQILPYNQQAVYLQGHVFRPGKYPYRDGLTISDLLHSYQDVMPEPADHAEIVRLQAPDYRPETISVSLADVLIGNSTILLKPFDLVRVFSRYEIDSPKVTIEGQVLRPGEYPMSKGMTVAGLVAMAGGFKRSAYRDSADLASYVVENGQKVVIDHRLVDIERALAGDKSADAALKPGDLVSIRQLAGWQDIGATVSLAGEIEHPGSYGIKQGEHLSAVIMRAGGFRESAYPAAAVLQRVQVRELGEQARQEMIQRLETAPVNFQPGAMSAQEQTTLQQSLEQQRLHILTLVRSRPATGRQVINISSDIASWSNTSADIELRAGDTLVIPKRPNFVMVTGQVYNATAISFVPGRTVAWYLQKAGDATASGDKKQTYILRADGSVVGHPNSWISGSFMNLRLHPGDAVIVPEKIIGGSPVWRNVIAAAQIMSSVALTGAITGIY
jgi:protein involved in polysaccharide export with SLBB domain